MDVTPSILTADFCKLGETLDEAIEAGINWIHMDVMDGNWVINKTITFGPAIIRSVRERLGDEEKGIRDGRQLEKSRNRKIRRKGKKKREEGP